MRVDDEPPSGPGQAALRPPGREDIRGQGPARAERPAFFPAAAAMAAPSQPPDRLPGRPRVGLLLGLLTTLTLLVVGGLLANGEIGQVAFAGATVLPFMWLAGLVQLGAQSPTARVAAWAWLWLVLLGIGAFDLLTLVSALAPAAEEPPAGEMPAELLVPLGAMFGMVAFGLLVGMLLAATGAWAGLGRRLGGRLDRSSLGHAVGCVGLVAFCFLAAAPLVALGGEAPILLAIAESSDFLGDERGHAGELLDTYYELAWTVPLAFMLVGVPALRGPAAGLARLGVRPLGARHVLLALGLTTVLLAVGLAIDEATVAIWEALDWPTTDAELVDELFGAALTPVGAVASAVAAGLGEELLVRGALQPRFGWLLPNLAFTASHAYQYGPDALVSVFVLGAVLAGIRARWSTSVSIVAHILYDLVSFLGAAYGWPGF